MREFFWIVLLSLCLPAPRVAAQALSSPPNPATPVSRSHTALNGTTALVVGSLSLAALAIPSHENQAWLAGHLEDVPPWADGAMDLGTVYGDGVVLGGAALLAAGTGALFHQERLSASGRDLMTSLGVAWAATWMLKVSVNAKRPNGGAYSFPSGHTATAFAAAPVIRHHYGRLAGAAAYSLGVLTGLGRVEDNKHYLRDVLVGAAIGYTAGHLAVSNDRFSLGAVPGGWGVSLPLNF